MLNNKKCPMCGTIFKPKRKSQKTCSRECGFKSRSIKIMGSKNSKYNHELKFRACLYCGKLFRPKSKSDVGIYCCRKCKDNHLNEKFKVTLICEECGKKFIGVRNRVYKYAFRYCSRSCYLKNMNKRSYKVDYIINTLNKYGVGKIEEEKPFYWLKSAKGFNMFLDIFLPKYNIAIEYDGEHHFKPVYNEDFDYKQKRDITKDLLCFINNVNLIRFSYKEQLTENYILQKLGFMV